MKKNLFTLSTLVLLAASVTFTSCKKEDNTPPDVTLNGSDETISLQSNYVDKGATAKDSKDGTISPTMSGNVDVNHTGVYPIVYTATDAAGNSSTATRNVTVVNDLDAMTGVYTCVINPGAYTYTQTIAASTTVNRRLSFSKFGDYSNNTAIYADVTNTGATSPINLPSQTAIQVGSPAADRTFSGTGSRTTGGLTLTYTEVTTGGGGTYTEVFSKQ
ncbi:MAG: immunoglobulin-like domain-containing protein [Bacteroidota bacterium]